MESTHDLFSLDTDGDWSILTSYIGGDEASITVTHLLNHLRNLGVKSCIVENQYIDRDYSSDYQFFYALTFRHYNRFCKRAHFFTCNICDVLQEQFSADTLKKFQDQAKSNYFGFSVIRSLPNAPIGRTVLKGLVRSPYNSDATVTCRADYTVNLLGIDLIVTGAVFMQQDTRVGACAQVSIWISMRHLHTRYGYNWYSLADITRLAMPMTKVEASSLPAGSEFLTMESMFQAIQKAGVQPLLIGKNKIEEKILPYVESGLPVIVGLSMGSGTLGHTVTVVGRIFTRLDNASNQASDYISTYIVHDDQSGPYKNLPVKKRKGVKTDSLENTITWNDCELNVNNHASFAIVPLPVKVFSTADAAEIAAKDRITNVMDNMDKTLNDLDHKNHPINSRLIEDLQKAYTKQNVILRTYLSSAAGYRRYIANNSTSDELKETMLTFHLPHYLWITEVSTRDAYNNSSPGLRRVYGHVVMDATSDTRISDGLLAMHLPGLLITHHIDEAGAKQKIEAIEDEDLYGCREKKL